MPKNNDKDSKTKPQASPAIQEEMPDYIWNYTIMTKNPIDFNKGYRHLKVIKLVKKIKAFPEAPQRSPVQSGKSFVIPKKTKAVVLRVLPSSLIIGLDGDPSPYRIPREDGSYTFIANRKYAIDQSKIIYSPELVPDTVPYVPTNADQTRTIDDNQLHYLGTGY